MTPTDTTIPTLAARALQCAELDVRAFNRARDLENGHADAAPVFPALDLMTTTEQATALDVWAADVEAFEARTGIDAAGRLADRARRRAAKALRRLADAEVQTMADLMVVAGVAEAVGRMGDHDEALEELHHSLACGARALARLVA